MRPKNLFSIISLFLISTITAFGQGEFLKKGESGTGVSMGFSTISSAEVYGNASIISAGYSYQTLVDITLGYSKTEPYSQIIIPSVSYYLTKQSVDTKETSAISLILRHVFDGHASPNTTKLGLGFYLAHDMCFNSSYIFQPNFSVSFFPSYETRTGKKSLMVGTIRVSAGYRPVNSWCIVLTPSASYQEGYAVFGGSLTIVTNIE